MEHIVGINDILNVVWKECDYLNATSGFNNIKIKLK